MKKVDLNCPKCSDNIVKSYGNEVKLRSKLIKWNEKGMHAICKSCGFEVPVGSDVLKAIESSFVYEVPSEKK